MPTTDGATPPVTCYRFLDFRLDASARTLHRGEVAIELQPRSFDLLLALVREPGRVHTRDELLREVWAGRVVGDAALSQSIAQVRAALGPDARELIRTVPRKGYAIDIAVGIAPSGPPPAARLVANGSTAPMDPMRDAKSPPDASIASTPAGADDRVVPARASARRWLAVATAALVSLVLAFAGSNRLGAVQSPRVLAVTLQPADVATRAARWLQPALSDVLRADRYADARFEFEPKERVRRLPDALEHRLAGRYRIEEVAGGHRVCVDWRLMGQGLRSRWRDCSTSDRLFALSDALDASLAQRLDD